MPAFFFENCIFALMSFTSPVFLFLFLPLVLAGGCLLRRTAGNIFLLAASLLFYAWGEGYLCGLLLGSILINYALGRLIPRAGRYAPVVLTLALVLNVALMAWFKYAAHLADLLNAAEESPLRGIFLPLGLSFFTFQGLSYLWDVQRGETLPQKNLLQFGLFIAFFPQLTSGPINRYNDLAPALRQRTVDRDGISEGLIRFIRGLAKKVLIADTLGVLATEVFALPDAELSTLLAWVGALAYTLQIYYDFSGYTDMAIGLARALGFRFRENFNYPYMATSIQDFWQRWHISLSTWLRDYVFRPFSVGLRHLAGPGLALAVMGTFVICGLWHGAGWNFLVWGGWFGLLIVLEQSRFLRFKKWPVLLRRLYMLLAVVCAWVIFRTSTLDEGMAFLARMFCYQQAVPTSPWLWFTPYSVFIGSLALLFAFPLRPAIARLWETRMKGAFRPVFSHLRYAAYLLLFFLALAEIARLNYNAFIYFQF